MSMLRAAAGAVPLHPLVGSRLTGFAVRLEPSTGVHDPLLAKLLLLDDGVMRLLWIACDLIGWSPHEAAELRRLLAERLSDEIEVLPGHVLVSCTHTHSGPVSMPFRGPLAEMDKDWCARTFNAIAEEAGALIPRLRPAAIAHACETVTGIGYNRQDGVSAIDERLLVAQVCDHDGQAIATLLNYATHPVVLGDRNLLFSADYPGYATQSVERTCGGIAMFVQGSAGDVNPHIFRDHAREAGTLAVAEQMGQALAAAARSAIAGASRRSDVRLATAEQCVELPLEPPPPSEQLTKFKRELTARTRGAATAGPAANEARWATFELAWLEELERAMDSNTVPGTLKVQLSAARLGDLAAIAIPFEVYSQIGLDVREQLKPLPVIIAAYTNGLFGYAPTDHAIDQGGYGPATSHRFFPHLLTPLARGTGAALTRAATQLVNTVMAR